MRLGLAVMVATGLMTTTAMADLRETCRDERDWSKKVQVCSELISSGNHQGDQLAEGYFHRGRAYNNLGEPERAIEDYTAALELSPNDFATYSNRAHVYRKVGQYQSALADLEKALNLRSDAPYQTYMVRGFVHSALGNQDDAKADWDTGFEIGGALAISAYQNWMKRHGHYADEVNGVDSPATRKALIACSLDRKC